MLMPRGVGLRGLGDGPGSCSNGGSWNPGLNVCCAPPGTPALQDPCSILNNPAFIAQQNSQIEQDIATSGPLEQSTLLALTSVPINIGQDAVYCESNPGVTFTDASGVQITCPSPSHTDLTTGGQPMSTFSEAQLAQMLNSQFGSKASAIVGNKPFVAPTPVSTVQPTQGQINSVAPTLPGGSTNSVGAAAGTTSGSTAGSSSTGSTGLDLSFLTNTSLISGVPNWMVGVGAVAALMILPGLIGGRR